MTGLSAELNFAADRSENGVWSNFSPEIRTQALAAHAVEMRDARGQASAPSLDREGFAIAKAPLAAPPRWRDAEWVERVYTPTCLDLVQTLTGAAHVVNYHPGVLIRDSSGKGDAPAADFVHLDNTREAALARLEEITTPEQRQAHSRAHVYNVWRAITPPPQDVPLALCDQRSLDEADLVIGHTVEPGMTEGVPYVISLHNPAQRWFHFPDVMADEAIVFKGWDIDPAAPFGCLHGAFRGPARATVPRASVELRVFALFA